MLIIIQKCITQIDSVCTRKNIFLYNSTNLSPINTVIIKRNTIEWPQTPIICSALSENVSQKLC